MSQAAKNQRESKWHEKKYYIINNSESFVCSGHSKVNFGKQNTRVDIDPSYGSALHRPSNSY